MHLKETGKKRKKKKTDRQRARTSSCSDGSGMGVPSNSSWYSSGVSGNGGRSGEIGARVGGLGLDTSGGEGMNVCG